VAVDRARHVTFQEVLLLLGHLLAKAIIEASSEPVAFTLRVDQLRVAVDEGLDFVQASGLVIGDRHWLSLSLEAHALRWLHRLRGHRCGRRCSKKSWRLACCWLGCWLGSE